VRLTSLLMKRPVSNSILAVRWVVEMVIGARLMDGIAVVGNGCYNEAGGKEEDCWIMIQKQT
jgi:hypothetical protein